MTSGTGRAARRRRVLTEGARAASIDPSPYDEKAPRTAKTRRYAPEPGSVSFAVARRLLPTRTLPIVGAVALGLVAVAGVLAAHVQRGAIASALAVSRVPAFDLADPAALGRWLASALTLTCAALALVLYGLRQNRTDDVRGLYRWWLAVALVLGVASAVLSSRLHATIAEALAQSTGFSPLPHNAFWWLAPGAALAGALAVRPLGDLKESRLALSLLALSAGALATSVCASIGALPEAAAAHAVVVNFGSLLLSLVAAITAQLVFVRRVLLETDGMISPPVPRSKAGKRTQSETGDRRDPEPSRAQATPRATPPTVRIPEAPAKPAPKADESQWVDGSQGDPDAYDDDRPAGRKLSKAERKRLRRDKVRERAA